MATAATVTEAPADIISQRASILRQLKKNLLKQRERLLEYLDVLEHETENLDDGNLEKLTNHVDMERAVIREIRSFQKVIVPLEKLYQAAYPDTEEEIPALKRSLSDITQRILRRNRANCNLLKKEMARIESELSRIRIPAKKKNLFNLQEVSTIIDIST